MIKGSWALHGRFFMNLEDTGGLSDTAGLGVVLERVI